MECSSYSFLRVEELEQRPYHQPQLGAGQLRFAEPQVQGPEVAAAVVAQGAEGLGEEQ